MPEQGSGVIRGLSLTQPWATLVAIDAKKVETRSWGTRYRGRVAIHAAKGFPTYAQDICRGHVGRQADAIRAGGILACEDLVPVAAGEEGRG